MLLEPSKDWQLSNLTDIWTNAIRMVQYYINYYSWTLSAALAAGAKGRGRAEAGAEKGAAGAEKGAARGEPADGG